MARYELRIPKLGESVIEATLTAWLKEIGDTILADEGIFEVATDKVDTEIPCEVSGVLIEKRVQVDEVAKIGQIVGIVETDASDVSVKKVEKESPQPIIEAKQPDEVPIVIPEITNPIPSEKVSITSTEDRYYSPLVKSIAEKEGIMPTELDTITGTGLNQRVTKDDILTYVQNRGQKYTQPTKGSVENTNIAKNPVTLGDEIIPMDRMGKLIADHMIMSKQTSAHVQSFIEIDVTKMVQWRDKNKDAFQEKTGEKLTYTPILMLAVAQTIIDYPMVNISVEGTNIIKKKHINLGMATALPNGNLIVPVIKKAEELNLLGMAKAVNRLADLARNNKLSPDDIQGGTYTVTNVGSFGSITGTPIINQPQVAILALGAIRKMPSVIETPHGDYIGIRNKMIVAHSYDHRVINGALGGQFILRLKEIIENFDESQTYS
jgi:2-oxoglutarate dehydrogenase E2 component (dihydrolipoamide succinyltransferase)